MNSTPENVPARRELFLDLEDTIITPVDTSWDMVELMNVGRIRAFIEVFKPHSVSIFSFAIRNAREVKAFERTTRTMIERALGVTLDRIPTVDEDIIPISGRIKCPGLQMNKVSFTEIVNFWGKEETFRFCSRHWFADRWANEGIETEAILIDDCVINERWQLPDLHLAGGTVLVTSM